MAFLLRAALGAVAVEKVAQRVADLPIVFPDSCHSLRSRLLVFHLSCRRGEGEWKGTCRAKHGITVKESSSTSSGSESGKCSSPPAVVTSHSHAANSMNYASDHHIDSSVAVYYTFFNSITEQSADHFVLPCSSFVGTDGLTGSGSSLSSDAYSQVRVPRRMEANARERDRTCNLNTAYRKLRDLIPTEPRDRKLSKIEILRLAKSYIEHLDNVRAASLIGDFEQNPCARTSCSRQVCTFCLTNTKRRS